MTDRKKPGRLSNLQELVGMLSLAVQIQGEIANILEEYDARIYSLEQDRSRLLADYQALQLKCNSLERRCSELLYKFSELKKDG